MTPQSAKIMKVTFNIGDTPLTLDASREQIAAALDGAIRADEDFYAVCVQVVGNYLGQRVQKGAETAINRALSTQAAQVPARRAKTRKMRS